MAPRYTTMKLYGGRRDGEQDKLDGRHLCRSTQHGSQLETDSLFEVIWT